MHINRKILAALAGSALTLTMVSCGGGGGAGSATGDTITIGIKYDQPGLGQKVGEDFKGLDVDVARYVAKELGFADDKVIFKETPTPQRETAIQGGQVALIFATYSITDARKEKVSFAGPYFIAGQDLLVSADNTDITGPDAMNGKTLCSVAGSTPAQKIKGLPLTKVAVDGTAVSFTSEGGTIDASCLTGLANTTLTDGTVITQKGIPGSCTVRFCSAEPRAQDGRVTVLAYALGEESFSHTKNTNIYFDSGDPFQNLGEPFRNDRAIINKHAQASWRFQSGDCRSGRRNVRRRLHQG